MDLQTELYLAAGVGALVLGLGTLLRDPAWVRHRMFALFCACLAGWNLLAGLRRALDLPKFPWLQWSLLGACAVAPVGLHFSLVLVGRPGARRSLGLPLAYVAAGALWITSWTAIRQADVERWNFAAFLVMSPIFLAAGGVLLRRVHELPLGPTRRAYRALLIISSLAVVVGLSDFLHRPQDFPRLGSVATLVFLTFLCALTVRHRLLDFDGFFARGAALGLGAAVASLLIRGIVTVTEGRLLPLFLMVLVILALAGPLGRTLLEGVQRFQSDDPLARSLALVARELPLARSRAELWQILERAGRSLPGGANVAAWYERSASGPYRIVHHFGETPRVSGLPRDAVLPELLRRDRSAVLRHALEVESLETRGERRLRAESERQAVEEIGAQLVAPLLDGDELVGWASIGGVSELAISLDAVRALSAVGRQVAADLARVDALDHARRREALAAVGEMAASLAHEVRNPLGAIRGAAQVLEDEDDEETIREMQEVIQVETERLGRVVGDFLDFARPAPPRLVPMNVEQTCREAVDEAALAGLVMSVTWTVEEDLPEVRGDQSSLRAAFGNLVRNAAEATGPEGKLSIELSLEGQGSLALRFEDDGPGIDPTEVDRLLQPFQTTKEKGTGLGLPFVHRVVDAHQGQLRVEGRPGLGAALTVVLPTVVPNADPSKERE